MSVRAAARAAALALLPACCLAAPPAPAQDARAEARALGQAGQAAAGAIARDAGSAAAVPGFAGTAVPERGHTAGGMGTAARRALADPGDAGGAVGRTVVEGVARRPAAPASRSEPAIRRSDAVVAAPEAPAWRAGGLASGTARPCRAEVRDAAGGGACGRVTSCVGADCESVATPANTGFLDAATQLNMAFDMAATATGFVPRVFEGRRRACRIRWGGLANCCRNSGLLVGLAGCDANERELAAERNDRTTRYLGARCTRRTFFGFCIRRERAWCVFPSKLGRIFQEQARPQLGRGWGFGDGCRGFTVAELERIDFDRVDLSEFTRDVARADRAPGVGLPDAGGVGAAMRRRVRERFGGH